MDLNIKLKELRFEKNLTQEELSKKLGITRSALALYETGKRGIPNELLPIIAKFFNVSIDYLFDLKDY